MLFKRKRRNDRLEDVADQPGFQRSLFGIVVAVLLGLLFRAAFSEEAISGQVRRAAEKVHEKIWIEFDSADLSLSDGPFPEFAIVVRNVRLASDEVCWLSPIAEVDELRLPLNVWALIQGRIVISEIHLGQVNLQLRTDTAKCREKKAAIASAGGTANPGFNSPDGKAPAPDAGVTKTSEPVWKAPETRGPISRVFVHSLQVHYLPIPFTGFEIDRLDIERRSESPFAAIITGELNLGGATLSGDYSSRAKFRIDYGHPGVSLKASGTWREGSYNFDVQGDLETKLLNMSGSIDHLPLSQILPALKKYDLLKGEYDGRQIWLNLKLKTPEAKAWDHGVPVDVQAFSFEGDIGKVEARAFHVMKWDPLEFSNTEIIFRGLQVEKLLRLFGQTEKPKSLGSLGELNGIMRLDSLRKFQLSGEYSGLEFIFANRGERKTQGISLMTGILDYNEGRWNLDVDKLRPHDGLFIGDIHLSGIESTGDTHLKIHMDEMHLRPEVQALMSGGGSLGRWAGDLNVTAKRGEILDVSGQLMAQELLVDGVSIARVRAQLSADKKAGVAQTLTMDVRAQDIHVDQVSPARRLIDPLVVGLSKTEKPDWQFPQVQLKTELKRQGEQWSQFTWQMKPVSFEQIQIQTEGGWAEPDGTLSGLIRADSKGKEIRWRVQGLRDAPVFVQDTK